jgi:hypothetical protein
LSSMLSMRCTIGHAAAFAGRDMSKSSMDGGERVGGDAEAVRQVSVKIGLGHLRMERRRGRHMGRHVECK